jgi:hypothetical protein
MLTALPSAAPRTLRRRLACAVALLWVCVVVAGFWKFEWQDRRPLDPALVATYFDTARTAPLAEAWLRTQPIGPGARATVVHVGAPACSCNRNAARHAAEIEGTYRARRVHFVDAHPEWVRAAPAALVFNAAGRLVYFGPYSEEADCGTSGGFVERALDALVAGRAAPTARPLGIGCLCITSTSA